MKILGRKKSLEKKPPLPVEPVDPEQSFYTQRAGDAPLNDSSGGYGRSTRRTSLHSPARRRETTNRVSNREVFFLLLRTGVIVVLLAGGFLALKLVLGLLSEPTEKDKEEWETNAVLMEKGTDTPAPSHAQTVSMELIGKRLKLWNEAERHLRSAAALEQRGIDDKAVLRLEKALQVAPDHRAAQRLLLKIHMRAGNYVEAIPLCIRLLDQDSRRWDIQTDLLQALQKLDQMEACLTLAEQMLEEEPNNLEVLRIAAFAHRAIGNVDEALTLFNRILENASRHEIALAGAGAIYQTQEVWEKAMPYYLELVRVHPGAEHYHNLIRCYARQGEAGKAVIFMGQAASLYGESEVSSWLRYDLESFDPIRETVEYRSFADRIVGVETRKAIEDIRKHETPQQEPLLPGGVDLPAQPELKLKSN